MTKNIAQEKGLVIRQILLESTKRLILLYKYGIIKRKRQEERTLIMDTITFEKLSPTTDADVKVYKEAFDFVFSNNDVRNVAISGAYGAGKSSILESYKKSCQSHWLKRVLNFFVNIFTKKKSDENDRNNTEKNKPKQRKYIHISTYYFIGLNKSSSILIFCDGIYFEGAISSRLSTFNNVAILSNVAKSGRLELPRHLLTVQADFPICSANHLLFKSHSARTTLILFNFAIILLFSFYSMIFQRIPLLPLQSYQIHITKYINFDFLKTSHYMKTSTTYWNVFSLLK